MAQDPVRTVLRVETAAVAPRRQLLSRRPRPR